MGFVTYWLEKDTLKALSGIVSDGHGAILEVSFPKEKPQQALKATTWEGGYEELKLYVAGIPTLTSKTEVLGEFMQNCDCEVHMMQTTAFVNFATKKTQLVQSSACTINSSSRDVPIIFPCDMHVKNRTPPPAQKIHQAKSFRR
jgi:hypothetical protein